MPNALVPNVVLPPVACCLLLGEPKADDLPSILLAGVVDFNVPPDCGCCWPKTYDAVDVRVENSPLEGGD